VLVHPDEEDVDSARQDENQYKKTNGGHDDSLHGGNVHRSFLSESKVWKSDFGRERRSAGELALPRESEGRESREGRCRADYGEDDGFK